MKYKDENGQWQDIILEPSGDTLPIGSIVDYDGAEVPANWEKVENVFGNECISLSTNNEGIDTEEGFINFPTIDFNSNESVFEKNTEVPYGIRIKKDCFVLVGGCVTCETDIAKLWVQVNGRWANREQKHTYQADGSNSIIIAPSVLQCKAGDIVNLSVAPTLEGNVYISPHSSWFFAYVISYF